MDNTKISGNYEADVLSKYDLVQNNCFKKAISYISNENILGQSIVVPMQVVATEAMIATARYINGDITRGELRQNEAKLINDLKSKGPEIKQRLRSRLREAKNNSLMQDLQYENNQLAKKLAEKPKEIRRYRPIFCHKYYAINTISCY